MYPIKKLEFKHGYYFSPGFYQDYWLKHIQDKVPNHDSFSNQKLEQYQELWLGSIFAALYTKSTGENYYVGLPDRDPPDVWVVRLEPIIYKGREASRLERMPVEITRCHLDEGENLFDQIMRKNKPAYSNTVLLVYLYGFGGKVNFSNLAKRLSKLEKVYPIEIFVLAKVAHDGNATLKPNTFVGMMIYPEQRQQTVSLDDEQAFFVEPSVIAKGKLGFSRNLRPTEVRAVTPPDFR